MSITVALVLAAVELEIVTGSMLAGPSSVKGAEPFSTHAETILSECCHQGIDSRVLSPGDRYVADCPRNNGLAFSNLTVIPLMFANSIHCHLSSLLVLQLASVLLGSSDPKVETRFNQQRQM